jgi:hypothetical protein
MAREDKEGLDGQWWRPYLPAGRVGGCIVAVNDDSDKAERKEG